MVGLTSKEREALAYIYELNEFKAYKKLCAYLRDRAVKQIVSQNMATPGSDKVIALLQGQIEALDKIVLQWQKIYKEESSKALKAKR